KAAKVWRASATTNAAEARGATATALPTLREASLVWLDACERGEVLSRNRRPYKPHTLRDYRADLERHVYDDLGAMRLDEVTADDCQALVDRLIGSGLSGSKARNVLVPLQSLYRRHRRQVRADPTSDLDLPEPGKRRERVASPAEAAALLEALLD